MQRRSVPRTDPRYNQIRARNNDSVKRSREKSRRERDETVEAISQLEEENKQLVEQIQTMKREFDQLQDLFKQHTGIAVDQLLSSETNSTESQPIEQSKPVLTINTNEVQTNATTSDVQLDPTTLDGAIVLINGVQYKIERKFNLHSIFQMNFPVYILFTFFLINQVISTNDQTKKKRDFYCSACKFMSDTIFREMNNVDPNERVQVGSYRVDGHGHQKLKDVPITETRYHAENVLDNICTKFLDKDMIPKQLRNIYEHAVSNCFE
ncbi:unnamed protein product [Adineta ricciae]|uniref:BZIP domain-containing protein n=1 Tax=Adineta ricciae TaxID=249248 RepID=A0A815K3R7_ADIRI|nr:unnamed protein product [Adineta ricciae]